MTTTSTIHPATTLVELPDGRVLAIAETGSSGGPTVVFLHPAPGSRAFDPDPVVTAEAAVRLITIDRPGYGGSSPVLEGSVPTLIGMADDIAFALRRLGIEQVGVVGWSAGGRVAVTLAARHSELVRAVAVVGTPAPDDEVPWIPDEQRQQLQAMRADPVGGYLALAGMLAALVGDVGVNPVGALGLITGVADQPLLAADDVRGRLGAMLSEAFRTGAFGASADIIAAEAVPWGYDLADVRAPLATFYGAADTIPVAAGVWYADQVQHGTQHVVPDVGHLLIVSEWAAILASVGC